ncbi:DUF4926 domain-containing protein [Kamptonema animale CS-326]|jgi:hypothetical protein|uniref:DUF4926 domain-containing protein n=1 Tax=Kamptonema animale TaxID=92934 RepID=UPI00232E54C1|nr:DUF4926 domain-containing protein [Kamptonema animale]MDB9510260.1 DUF4926 domain-containing protein [Kamptonema animale CS-326]
MKFNLFTQVALRQDIPEYNLKKGDVATIVDYHSSSNGGEEGYSLEGFNLPENCAEIFITVGADQIELSEGKKIAVAYSSCNQSS